MQIDRSNYEIWLIDWLDGSLDESQVARLLIFLNENPDIQEEFYEMSSFRIKSTGYTYDQKSSLKRTPQQITDSQFEYLCIAWLENDLSSLQKEEIKEIIARDAQKKKIFELIQKSKLIPDEIVYRDKKSLLKRSIPPVIIRLSVLGLSAAAIIALVIVFFFSGPDPLKLKTQAAALVEPPVNVTSVNREKNIPEGVKDLRKILPAKRVTGKLSAGTGKKILPYSGTEGKPVQFNDRQPAISDTSGILLSKVTVPYDTDLGRRTFTGDLIALQASVSSPVDYDDDNSSNFSRFIARTVRGKILKEKTLNEKPLKAYEIAEAGVAGLNKLFGWEMALDEKKDENGRLKSVYFSSKILKFNTPVKNPEPLP